MTERTKNKSAQDLNRLRNKALSPEERKEIATRASKEAARLRTLRAKERKETPQGSDPGKQK